MKLQTSFYHVLSKMLVFTSVLFSNTLWGQSPLEPCGFGAAMQMMQQQSQNYQNDLQKFDKKYAGLVSCENNTAYLIPVVFHVLHNNGPENISEAQIDEALAQMNLQFAGGEGGFNTHIQFTRARIDPNGNCTNGINRIFNSSPDATLGIYYEDVAMKNLSRWPTERYVNIWIVRCILPDNNCSDGNATAGYAYLAPAESEVDGIVITHKFLGTTGTATGNVANTLTHEMGIIFLYSMFGGQIIQIVILGAMMWLTVRPSAIESVIPKGAVQHLQPLIVHRHLQTVAAHALIRRQYQIPTPKKTICPIIISVKIASPSASQPA